ncbi:MAG TPA: hypothetical protein VMG31_12985 [Verrucomicrobiae bacterium]|nr:hypothetical protein [Verrucomicrobiae bacterium]
MIRALRLLGISLLTTLLWCGLAPAQGTFTGGVWTTIKNAPPVDIGHIMLLTDGSVLALGSTCGSAGGWYRLVPDRSGSYANGTWVSAGKMPPGYNPLYFSSQVLPSGSVVVMGGEYNVCNSEWTTRGALYSPWTNKWASLTAPHGWTSIGDAQSIVLPNGKMMLANCCTTDEAILTLNAGVPGWAATGADKFDSNDEEGWTMLPGGKVLTIDVYTSGGCCQEGYQIYDPSTGAWTTPDNTTVVNLVDPRSLEIGPAALLPNGTVFAAGATTNNAIYTISTGTWAPGPKFGDGLDIADGPVAVLPDGNLLLNTSPGVYQVGDRFFEWDGSHLHVVHGPRNASVDSSYYGHMVVLPTGQVLFTDFSQTVELYTSAGAPCAGCAPTITSVAATLTHGSTNNLIQGMQFNGVTQGAYYGDDDQSFTNFPLVRITDSTGRIVYCRTHAWAGGVATGTKLVSTQFDIPPGIALGTASLEVVANGIASAPVAVTID